MHICLHYQSIAQATGLIAQGFLGLKDQFRVESFAMVTFKIFSFVCQIQVRQV